MGPLLLRAAHVLPEQQRPLRRLLHCAPVCPQRLFMSPRLGQRASRPLQAPARPLATRGGIWRNPNPFSYFHTFTLPQFHIFTFPTAARSTVRRRGHSRLPRGGFSKPDISDLFGMRRSPHSSFLIDIRFLQYSSQSGSSFCMTQLESGSSFCCAVVKATHFLLCSALTFAIKYCIISHK